MPMINTTTLWFIVFIWLCSIATLPAQDFVETAKLSPTVRHDQQKFGGTVAISGNYAIVGARNEEYDANEENPMQQAGAAYIFEKENDVWVFKQKLVQEHRWFNDEFGVFVSIEGEYAVIGIRGEDLDDPNDPDSNRSTQVGAAMVYKRDTDGIWKEYQLLSAGDEPGRGGQTGEKFGFPVKIKEGIIIAGALRTSKWVNGEYLARIGSVYVFEKDETTGLWVKQKQLMASDPVGQDQFGKMFDINDGTIIIGAALHEPGGIGTWVGAAYVFTKDETGEWVERQKLEASNPASYAQFGESVAITGDYIFCGAQGLQTQYEFGNDSAYGAVYVFKKNTEGLWEEVQYMVLDDIGSFDEKFGQSISAYGDKVLISANEKYIDNRTGNGQGKCYLYELNPNSGTWDLIQTIVPENHYRPKEFGLHIIMNEDRIIVADENDDGSDQNVNYNFSGAAHIFEINESLSIPDRIQNSNDIQVFPNPVGNYFFIKSEHSLSSSTITITDMLGRTVYADFGISIDRNAKIPADFSKGTYVLQVISNGQTYITKFTK